METKLSGLSCRFANKLLLLFYCFKKNVHLNLVKHRVDALQDLSVFFSFLHSFCYERTKLHKNTNKQNFQNRQTYCMLLTIGYYNL